MKNSLPPKVVMVKDEQPRTPESFVGLFNLFEVVSVTEFGAFLSWGFAKDLFVPWAEQKRQMKVGESYIVYVYQDEKTGRLAGSSKINKFLNARPVDLCENQTVDLLICHQTDMGINAIVNNAFWGLLYKTEVFQTLSYGQKIKGFVKKVREDGKIDLCLQRPGYHAVGGLSGMILEHLKAQGGTSSLTDKTPPEKIYQLFGVSKKKFKMAVGLLFKERQILIEKDQIRLVQGQKMDFTSGRKGC
ncbi:MAG: GntR family transcriptional regulator [Candidatus Omnitrophica bacterium]|nr:GntR family transcriptional regulator [Candidatus Omnitrophota bacterium]